MYTKTRFILGLAALAIGLSVATSQAQDKKEGTQKQESKPDKYQSAATIDFQKELGVALDSLTTLGARIEQTRRDGDPVCLALLATELGVAEQLSEKKAPLTSAELLKQAAHLAEVRGVATELKAVALITPDEEAQKKLKMLSDKSEEREKQEVEAAKKGERPRGIWNELIVNNHSHQRVDVHYNGRHVGYVAPHGHRHFYINDHSHEHHFDLEAWGSQGGHWRRHQHGDYRNFTWTLNP